MLRKFLLVGLLAAAGVVGAQPYPSKAIRFIVPDAPGGVSDLRSRQLGAKLSEQIGQSVVIDNRPGGSFIIGAEAAAKAPADGYTIFLGSIVTHSLNPLLFAKLPYKPDDFVPVTLLSAGPIMLVAHPSVPAANLRELIEPYKSGGTMIQDVVGGHLPLTLSYWSVIGPHVKSGKMRVYGVGSTRRLEAAPDVPTFAEAGVPGIDGQGWQGIFVPVGTPRPVVLKLQAEVARAINSPEIRNTIIETGAEPGGNSPEEFAAMIRADQEKWRRLAAAASLAQQ